MKKTAYKWQHYQALMDNAIDGIVIMDVLGNILDANPSFSRMLGYTSDEIKKLHLSDINAQWSKKELLRIINQRIGKGEYFETVHRRKDGSQISVEVSSTVTIIDDEIYVFSSCRDITQRKEAQDALELMKYSIDHLMDSVHWVDKDAHIVYANEMMCRKLGYTLDELLSLTIPDIDPNISAEEWPARWSEFKRAGSLTFKTTHRCKNGHVFPVEVRLNNISFRGKELNCVYAQDITERQNAEDLIWRRANYDSLTSLPNRHLFQNRLKQELLRAKRSELPLCVLLIDLDEFKEVNDSLGHDQGDALLKEVGARITKSVRETDTVARLGGDEFIVLLPQITDAYRADDIAQKIIGDLEKPFVLNDNVVYISASIGITVCPSDAMDVDSVLKNADQAMYLSKQLGRNRFSYFTPRLQEESQNRFILTNELREALVANEQFEILYQPIVNLVTGGINKAEALLRWQHPKRGLIPPADFIPLAEKSRLIVDMGYFVFQQAAQQLKVWRDLFREDFQISVNRSPVEFMEFLRWDHNMVSCYHQLLSDVGGGIVFEITENMLINTENNNVRGLISKFRMLGIQVALDDFGTGYSSLSYLDKFEIDYLKIDKSFIKDLSVDDRKVALCETIIQLAHKLGHQVIAEGVETEDQLKILIDAGCDYGQGYLFSKPVPATDFEVLLAH